MTNAGLLCLFLFYATIERSHCSCVSDGTGPVKCYMYVTTSTGKVVRMQPQLTFDHPPTCKLVTVASAKYGITNLTVDVNETMAIIHLYDNNPHDYIIDFTYTLSVDKNCSVTMAATQQQTIIVSIIGKPSITYIDDQPHTLTCSYMSNVPAEWLKFEKDGATLGYCVPEPQTFAGGYTIYHPFNRNRNVCILEMTDEMDGVYTCTTKFPDVTDSFTSTNNVTLTMPNRGNDAKSETT